MCMNYNACRQEIRVTKKKKKKRNTKPLTRILLGDLALKKKYIFMTLQYSLANMYLSRARHFVHQQICDIVAQH